MNQQMKTYGVMINLDYSHQPFNECQLIWQKIVKKMQQEHFHVDKRMFLITTFQEKEVICDKARQVLQTVDNSLEVYNKYAYQYITDFFTIDMSDYVDLRLPTSDIGPVFNIRNGGRQYQEKTQRL